MQRSGNPQIAVYTLLGLLLSDEKQDLDRAVQVLLEGRAHYPADEWILNNLAYVYLLNAQPQNAREVLESVRKGHQLNPFLTATWGLLHLYEDNFDLGMQGYQNAITIARKHGDFELSHAIRQKMHLELARAYTRKGDSLAAEREIKAGLLIKTGRRIFRRQLATLQKSFRAIDQTRE